MKTVTTTPPSIASEVLLAQSYDKVLDDMKALPEDRLLAVNADITTSVAIALAAYTWLMAHKDEIEGLSPRHDLRFIYNLENYARALVRANMLHAIALKPPDNLQALVEQGLSAREKFRADVNTLCIHGVIDSKSLQEYCGLTGYKNVAYDIQLLTTVLKANWRQIDGRCMTRLEDLETAEKIATQLLRLVGLKKQVVERSAESADMRNRAFTLVVRSYDELRRLVSYVRWHEGDADVIAPSFYGRKRKRNSKDTEAKETPTGTHSRGGGSGLTSTRGPSP